MDICAKQVALKCIVKETDIDLAKKIDATYIRINVNYTCGDLGYIGENTSYIFQLNLL
jgi:hypothetical protein